MKSPGGGNISAAGKLYKGAISFRVTGFVLDVMNLQVVDKYIWSPDKWTMYPDLVESIMVRRVPPQILVHPSLQNKTI